MKVLVIGNPTSGGGRARGACQRLARALTAKGHEVEVYLTKAAGDGAARAGALEPGVEGLVVAGGDGTLNEVLNGLEDPGRVPLIQLPMGTANILARELGLPFEPEATAAVVDRARVRRVDLGHLGTRRFLMVVSAGFDAQVTAELKRSRKGTLGFLGYVKPVTKVWTRYRPPALTVSVDGGPPLTGSWVVVTNTKNYGGLFTLAETASVDSGVLDVLVFAGGGTLDFMRYALKGLGGGGVSGLRGVTARRGRAVSITSAGPVDVELDGDHWGQTPCEITLSPAAVPVFVP